MQGRLKAKKLPSATLPDTWPKPLVPYKGSVGRHPVEAQPYVFSSRVDNAGRHKVVPEMLYPLQANRQPVPKHQVLEDDYKSLYGFIANQILIRKIYPDLYTAIDVNSFFKAGRLKEVRQHLPDLIAYNPGMDPPPGYMYREYKKSLAHKRDKSTGVVRELTCPPTVFIRGPFQNFVSLNTPNFSVNSKYFDSSVIWGGPPIKDIEVYNEVHSISATAVHADFGRSLSRRTKKICRKKKNAPTENSKPSSSSAKPEKQSR